MFVPLWTISTWSPCLKLVWSSFKICDFKFNDFGPSKLSIWNLEFALYTQEFTKTSLNDLLENLVFIIGLPRLLILIESPSATPLRYSEICSNFAKEPKIVKVTFFVRSPFSYPKYIWLLRISAANGMAVSIPEQPKNWLIDLFVYFMLVFSPETRTPDSSKPIVESTEIIEDPIDTASVHFELGVTLKVPWTADGIS